MTPPAVFARALAVAWLLPAAAVAAADGAGAYPQRPIRLVVAQTAGGNADFVARSYAQRLAERLGQQIVVDNRPGGGGVIGTELVVRAAPDGYTLLLAPTSHGINPSILDKLPYDSVRDLAPISLLGTAPNMLVVGSGFAPRTVREIIAAARAQPGKLHYSSSGVATSPHLAGALFCHLAGVDMQHVAYKGGPAAMIAVSSGEADMSFGSMASALPLVRAGKLRPVAITARMRWPSLPELPTVAESGLPGYENSLWQALLAPAKTPPAVVARLHREIAAIAKIPEFRERLMVEGTEAVGSTPAALAEHIAQEIERWRKVVKAAGIKAN